MLGVTGSIAAYKAADLASKLAQNGALVDVILTENAEKFITPLTFQTLTGRKAHTSLWEGDAHVVHVGLGERADLLVIAPCTADTLAKLTHGLANNLLTVTALASRCPVLLVPAMDGAMFQNPATQANLETVRSRGVRIIGPVSGRMASGLLGPGRMLEPAEILGHIRLVLGENGPLRGQHILISAGGTQEALDPVRYLTNRSTGKQGFALAQAALDLGAKVSLVAGATAAILPTPAGAARFDVESADQMAEVVLQLAGEADALVMAAAVADFRAKAPSPHKIKKVETPPAIEIERTPDILSLVSEQRAQTGKPRVVVGFAAESQNLLENARDKLKRKRLSMVVANDISAKDAGFAVDTNRLSLVTPEGVEQLPLMSKAEAAAAVMQRVTEMLRDPGPVTN